MAGGKTVAYDIHIHRPRFRNIVYGDEMSILTTGVMLEIRKTTDRYCT